MYPLLSSISFDSGSAYGGGGPEDSGVRSNRTPCIGCDVVQSSPPEGCCTGRHTAQQPECGDCKVAVGCAERRRVRAARPEVPPVRACLQVASCCPLRRPPLAAAGNAYGGGDRRWVVGGHDLLGRGGRPAGPVRCPGDGRRGDHGKLSTRRLPVLAGFGRRWSAGAIRWPGRLM